MQGTYLKKYIQWLTTLSVADNRPTSLSNCCIPNLQIPRNSPKIRTYSSSKSSNVIDLGVNRKRVCDFLLVIDSNFGRICYTVFEILTFKAGKGRVFPPILV